MVGKVVVRYLELIYQHGDGEEGVILCLILHVTRKNLGEQALRNRGAIFVTGRIVRVNDPSAF